MTKTSNDTVTSEIDTLIQDLEDLRLEFETRSLFLQQRIVSIQNRQLATDASSVGAATGSSPSIHEHIKNSLAICSGPIPPRTRNPFLIGDIVRITNNYNNLRNTEGVVIKSLPRTVIIRIDDGSEHKKSINTVTLVRRSH